MTPATSRRTTRGAVHAVATSLPLYIQLGGVYASIGLVFKAFSLRPAFAAGVAHHDRAACFWCDEESTECGAHLLTCSHPPEDFSGRVTGMLKQIMLEAEPPADPAAPLPWPRARELRALTYVYRLEWPNMTKTTLTATLKSLGRFINTYRNTIGATLEPGARKPIQRIAIAHPDLLLPNALV